jgi:hypothetical protein
MTKTRATLRSLRYFDRFVIHGKRVVLGVETDDPCAYMGHEGVLSFLQVYCNDPTLNETGFKWDAESLEHLRHISKCPHCMAKVFSVPDAPLRVATSKALAFAEAS